jgi:hypothetical protein
MNIVDKLKAARQERARAYSVIQTTKVRGRAVSGVMFSRYEIARDLVKAILKSGDYKAYLREKALTRQRMDRIKRGHTPRSELSRIAAEKKQAKESERLSAKIAKETFKNTFVGPPRPIRDVIGYGAYYRWKEQRKEKVAMTEDQRKKRVIELKTKYRRAAGVPSREELAQRAAEKAAAADARRIAKADFLARFIGPPKPLKAMNDAEHYAWRMRNDPEFYAKELDRAQRYKARTRPGYKDSIVKWAKTPPAVKQVKHLQYLISRQIDRSKNENHQRAA